MGCTLKRFPLRKRSANTHTCEERSNRECERDANEKGRCVKKTPNAQKRTNNNSLHKNSSSSGDSSIAGIAFISNVDVYSAAGVWVWVSVINGIKTEKKREVVCSHSIWAHLNTISWVFTVYYLVQLHNKYNASPNLVPEKWRTRVQISFKLKSIPLAQCH